MKWSMASVGVIVLGIIGVMVIALFQQLTTSSENDYYLLKEITEASMIESIDLKYYRETGDLKIVKEKFVENFTRRYNESTLFIGTKYTIRFFDIIETPPKATVTIDTGLDKYRIYTVEDNYTVYNNLTGILEYIGKPVVPGVKSANPFIEKTFQQTIYFVYDTENSKPLNIPKEINTINIKNQKITSIVSESIDDDNEIWLALLKNEVDWSAITTPYTTNYYDEYRTGTASASYYNCGPSAEVRGGNMSSLPTRCAEFTNPYDYNKMQLPWIKVSGSSNYIYKYEVTWSYEEYEYK